MKNFKIAIKVAIFDIGTKLFGNSEPYIVQMPPNQFRFYPTKLVREEVKFEKFQDGYHGGHTGLDKQNISA